MEEVERRHICRVLEDVNWVMKGPNGAASVLELPVSTGAVVHVSRSPRTVDFLRLGDDNEFYAHLARRLGWLRLDHVLDEGDAESIRRGGE